MPYRLKPNGDLECDTAEEAVRLQDARGKTGSPRTRGGRGLRGRPTFKPSTLKLLQTLKEAYPNALPSHELAARMSLPTPKSLPPLFMGLRAQLRKIHVKFEDVITRKLRSEKGKLFGLYTITERGLTVLQEQEAKQGL